jgi:hypothetical protein
MVEMQVLVHHHEEAKGRWRRRGKGGKGGGERGRVVMPTAAVLALTRPDLTCWLTRLTPRCPLPRFALVRD